MSGGIGLLAKLGGPWPYVACAALGAILAASASIAIEELRIGRVAAQRDDFSHQVEGATKSANDQAVANADCRVQVKGRDRALVDLSAKVEAMRFDLGAADRRWRAAEEQSQAIAGNLSAVIAQRNAAALANPEQVGKLGPIGREAFAHLFDRPEFAP